LAVLTVLADAAVDTAVIESATAAARLLMAASQYNNAAYFKHRCIAKNVYPTQDTCVHYDVRWEHNTGSNEHLRR